MFTDAKKKEAVWKVIQTASLFCFDSVEVRT